jgi:hypothetical protein
MAGKNKGKIARAREYITANSDAQISSFGRELFF